MVVRYNKVLQYFSLIFILMSSMAFAEEADKAQILLAVQKKAEIAIVELESAIGKCDEAKKASKLNASYFKGINISYKEMMAALFYFSAKADLECITEAKYKNLAYSLLKYQSTLKYYKKHHELKYFNKDYELLPYVLFDPGHDEALEIKYNKIAPKSRATLEQILELSKPFDSGKLLKQVELEIYGITPKDIYY